VWGVRRGSVEWWEIRLVSQLRFIGRGVDDDEEDDEEWFVEMAV